MGLINFVKAAGAKIFGKDDEKEINEGAKAASDDKNMEEIRENLRQRKLEGRLRQQIETHGFEIENLVIAYDGETVVISGAVDTNEIREKVLLAVGNVDGVGAVDDRIEVTNPEPEAVFYTVERGDTLSKIAKEQYGNAGKYPVIFEANRPMLEDPDKIYPGQVLRIPPID